VVLLNLGFLRLTGRSKESKKLQMIEFEEFWKAYPRKVGRMKAESIWRKLQPEEQQLAMRGLTLWKQTYQWSRVNGDGLYIPYGSTFLQQKRYLDEPWKGAFDEA